MSNSQLKCWSCEQIFVYPQDFKEHMKYPCIREEISIISKHNQKKIPNEQSYDNVYMGSQQRRPYPSHWQNPNDTMVLDKNLKIKKKSPHHKNFRNINNDDTMINFNNIHCSKDIEEETEEFYGLNTLNYQKQQNYLIYNEMINNSIITTTDTEKSEIDILNSSYLYTGNKKENYQSQIPHPQSKLKELEEFGDYFMN